MSRQYNTDGLLVFPTDNGEPITLNAFESIECAIAFDVRDWSEDRRSAWIYAIVYGWDHEDSWDKVAKKFSWDEEDRERANVMHKQWIKAKETQEAIKPRSKSRHGAYAQIQHFCGNCNAMLHGKPKFCSSCGRGVMWE